MWMISKIRLAHDPSAGRRGLVAKGLEDDPFPDFRLDPPDMKHIWGDL
jgi:hypothetical protein